jgi:hypothetical protein
MNLTRWIIGVSLWGVALAVPGVSQRTFIVDSANGPGATHTDIQPALNASQRGDTIILRIGNGQPYTSSTDITHGLRIVAPGAITPLWAANGNIRIPAGDLFVIDNVRFGGPSPRYGFQLIDCAGTVLLSRLFQGNVAGIDGGGIGAMFNCDRVVYNRCRVHYTLSWGLHVDRSKVYLLDSAIQSDFSWSFGGLGQGEVELFDHSKIWVVNSRVRGGDYLSPIYHPFAGLYLNEHCHAFISGRSEFLGGIDRQLFPTVPQRAGLQNLLRATWTGQVVRYGAFMALDPITKCIGPRVTGGDELVTEFPAVMPRDAIRGQRQRIPMMGPTNSLVALFVSVLTPRPPISTDLGDIWLDPPTTVLLGAGAVSVSRDLELSTVIPKFLPVGEVLVYQAASLSPAADLLFSAPGFAVVQ